MGFRSRRRVYASCDKITDLLLSCAEIDQLEQEGPKSVAGVTGTAAQHLSQHKVC